MERRKLGEGELFLIGLLGVVGMLCLATGWMYYCHCRRCSEIEVEKLNTVQALSARGMNPQEIVSVVEGTAGETVADKRAALARQLESRGTLPSQIVAIVSACYPQQEDHPKPTNK